jgi:nickel/cobalt transporter (NicO) family protein
MDCGKHTKTKNTHWHKHADGDYHHHDHNHHNEHIHLHERKKVKSLTPWILFTIFVFGPCEPMIPLVMYPAARNDTFGLIMVCIIFGLVTILTMTTAVMISLWGFKLFHFEKLEKYTATIADTTILICGLAIQFWGCDYIPNCFINSLNLVDTILTYGTYNLKFMGYRRQ